MQRRLAGTTGRSRGDQHDHKNNETPVGGNWRERYKHGAHGDFTARPGSDERRTDVDYWVSQALDGRVSRRSEKQANSNGELIRVNAAQRWQRHELRRQALLNRHYSLAYKSFS